MVRRHNQFRTRSRQMRARIIDSTLGTLLPVPVGLACHPRCLPVMAVISRRTGSECEAVAAPTPEPGVTVAGGFDACEELMRRVRATVLMTLCAVLMLLHRHTRARSLLHIQRRAVAAEHLRRRPFR